MLKTTEESEFQQFYFRIKNTKTIILFKYTPIVYTPVVATKIYFDTETSDRTYGTATILSNFIYVAKIILIETKYC